MFGSPISIEQSMIRDKLRFHFMHDLNELNTCFQIKVTRIFKPFDNMKQTFLQWRKKRLLHQNKNLILLRITLTVIKYVISFLIQTYILEYGPKTNFLSVTLQNYNYFFCNPFAPFMNFLCKFVFGFGQIFRTFECFDFQGFCQRSSKNLCGFVLFCTQVKASRAPPSAE